MKKIAIIFGGRSAEHEISILSSRNIVSALDRSIFSPVLIAISKEGTWYSFTDETLLNRFSAVTDSEVGNSMEPASLICKGGKPHLLSIKSGSTQAIDAAFPILHGTFGEDGTIQGLFRMMNLPFVGCDVLASAAGMDKEVMKRMLRDAGIPIAKWILLTKNCHIEFEQITDNIGLPFFIKPANAGSSVGVHKVKSKADFETFLKDSLSYDHKVLAEEFIQGREIECSVMGLTSSPKASVPGEVIPHHEFYSYEAKYLDENGASVEIPAKVTKGELEMIQRTAIQTFQVLGCSGLTRVDFFLKSNSQCVVNEVNTIPGFTKISIYPKMWEASGIGYTKLITQLLDFAFQKFELDQSLKTNFR